MSSGKIEKLVMAALMAALTYIAAAVLPIPSPIGGFIHPGDGLVLLSGIILGPVYGGFAAGIGSMFVDLLSPAYAVYAPATFIIKAFTAIVGGFIYHKLVATNLSSRFKLLPIISAGICGSFVVTVGYFIYESIFLGFGLAAGANVPFNIIQNIFGIIVSTALLPILAKTPIVRDLIFQSKTA